MSTLIVRNLPDELHQQLKARAASNHRSLNKEVIRVVEASLRAPVPVVPAVAAGAADGLGRLSADDLEAALTDERYVNFRSQAELEAWNMELRADRDEVVGQSE